MHSRGRRTPDGPFSRSTAILCPAVTEDNAVWPATAAGTLVDDAECLPGYNGSAVRSCLEATMAPGVWGPIVAACERTCHSIGSQAQYADVH